MDWPAAFTAASQALGLAKTLVEVDRTLDHATFKMKIADLSSNVADLKLALIEAQSEAAGKDEAIAKLKEAFAFREEQTVRVRGLRYEKAPDGSGPEGMPFCDRCERVDGRLIRIAGTHTKDGYRSVCPQCKADYGREHGFPYRPPSAAPQDSK
jgi:hypothetical protein